MKQDYLAYKKKKLGETFDGGMPEIKGPETRLRKMLPAIIVGFIVAFIFAIIIVANFGSKVDVEYGRFSSDNETYDLNDDSVVSGEVEGKHNIDSRLKSLQVEETTPRAKKEDKEEIVTETKTIYASDLKSENKEADTNKITYSKVLLGRYTTMEEAKAAQEKLRNTSGVQAFVRKMGNVYALQVGSYLNSEQAKQVATRFSNMDYQVWILED